MHSRTTPSRFPSKWAAIASVFFGALAVVRAPTQTTRVVGPGSIPEIRDALALSTTGDVILVQPGLYAHFQCQLGVSVIAASPGSVDVRYDPAYATTPCDLPCLLAEGPTRFLLPPDEVAHVVGIRFQGNTTGQFFPARHRVVVESGTVSFEDCVFLADGRVALSVLQSRVHLQGCTALSGSFLEGAAAVEAVDSDVVAVDCQISGASTQGFSQGFQPGEGFLLERSRLHGAHCQILGGSTLFGSFGAPAVDADLDSRVWLSDSSLEGGIGKCAFSGFGNFRLSRTTLIHNAASCPGPAPGPGLLSARRTGPLRVGAGVQVDFETDPSELIFVVVATKSGRTLLPGVVEQPLWLDAALYQVSTVLTADSMGLASESWQVPNNPLLLGRRFWAAGVSGLLAGGLLQASPALGGVVR